MTRFALFLFFFVILTPKALSQPPLAWAGQLEKKNIWSYWSGAVAAVDVDKAGSMCVVGKFSDSIDFDPSSSNFYLKTSGNSAFIAKYSSTGKLLWAKDIATQGYGGLSISTVKFDSLGYVYISGSFWGTIDFDPSPQIFVLSGQGDGFVMKLTPNGDFLWTKQLKQESGTNHVKDIAFDDQLSLYLTGTYTGITDMNPGPKAFYLPISDLPNVFVTKLDKYGNFKWAKGLHGDTCSVNDIKCDKYGNVHFCGSAGTGTDMDPGESKVYPKSSAGYISKLDSAGQYLTSFFFEGSCNIKSIELSDGIILLGDIQGPTDIDPGPIQNQITPTKGGICFFSKLDTMGNLLWSKQIVGTNSPSSPNSMFASDVQTNAKKELYVFTFFSGTYDFDPGPSTAYFTAKITTNNVVMSFSSYDQAGNLLWTHTLPNCDFPLTYSPTKVTSEGDIYTANGFLDSIDCDPGNSTYILSPKNGSFFLRKLSSCKNLPTIELSSDRTFICKGEEILLRASGGISYSWNNNFQPAPVVNTYPLMTTTYQVIGKDNFGCKSSAEVLSLFTSALR